ncbi:hypothetical protein PSTG_19931 [Puccinia striiformis f. sp. tritici PST-78]|uniref:HAT C-terminal dimerisation domain-containing protein n=1 Tax=Puccinia striiformis f. sp. tritici PST-78 TaxID=1165861 RepID=A0A0L0UID4_9BASI|nr:hypothetical protein PSTG_19931 [Puccinia striiformis f. sp. tritici PST-78]
MGLMSATTVDIEQSFSFGREYVSVRRHRLSPSSLTRGLTVAFYSKNGKIASGVLRRWKLDHKNEKGKGKNIVIEIDGAEDKDKE